MREILLLSIGFLAFVGAIRGLINCFVVTANKSMVLSLRAPQLFPFFSKCNVLQSMTNLEF